MLINGLTMLFIAIWYHLIFGTKPYIYGSNFFGSNFLILNYSVKVEFRDTIKYDV
nr:MAG TPA: hypothetical protein [Bacteriophage sp.]